MKPKIGDTVQFKKSGIIGTVEKILRGACIVDTHGSKLSAWPEDLIICGLSEVSLDKEMEEYQRICDEIMEIQGIKPIEAEIKEAKTYWDSIKDAWICPEGYQFVDENGNVINATKIVLEKKEGYPKTYGECCRVLFIDEHEVVLDYLNKSFKIKDYSFEHLCKLNVLSKLLICRDAYWKIAGEEIGLDKPWEPDWDDDEWPDMYYISWSGKYLDKEKGYPCCNMKLIFPTEEMRDAFYENFKEQIESVKELL